MNRKKNLNSITAVAQVVLTHIDGFFLNNLLLAVISPVRSEAWLIIVLTRVTAFLKEWLVSISCSVLLFYYEVRRTIEVSLACFISLHDHLWIFLLLLQLVGVLTDVCKKLTSAEIILSPLRDVVVGLLFLEALENYLVLSCDLHKISLAGFSIETLFKLKGRGTRHSCHLLGLCDPHGSSYGV